MVGILLFWAGFARPCLSLPFSYPLQVPQGPAVEGFVDQVNSSSMVTEEMEEEELEEEGMEVKLEAVHVVEGVRDLKVAFHNDSHGTLISKGW